MAPQRDPADVLAIRTLRKRIEADMVAATDDEEERRRRGNHKTNQV